MTGAALPSEVVADLYRAACLAELDALKVGNVHSYAAGHRMEVADFVTSAEVSAPHLAAPEAGVGRRVRRGVEATLEAVGQNTNLGILLLCAPLALAAGTAGHLGDVLRNTLAGLDEADGAEVFAAIRRANPGGLGRTERHDVTAEGPAVTLRAAMAEAADRDRIARAYVTDFEDVFTIGLSALDTARTGGLTPPWTTTAVHIAFLTRIPDSHVARKYGSAKAEQVRREAQDALSRLNLRERPIETLLAHDRSLKQAKINPGTSADLTVATLFADTVLVARGEARDEQKRRT